MFVYHSRAVDALGGGEYDFVVGASVLGDDYAQVVEWVVEAEIACVDCDAKLLVAVVGVDVGARAYGDAYGGGEVAYGETCLQECVVGIALVIDSDQIVAGLMLTCSLGSVMV